MLETINSTLTPIQLAKISIDLSLTIIFNLFNDISSLSSEYIYGED